MEGQAMIGGRWVSHDREAAIGPIKQPRLDNDTADTRPMPTDKLGGGVDHDIRPPLNRTAQVGRGEGIVDNERGVVTVCDGGYGFNIKDVAARIANSFAEEGFGVRSQRGAPG